MYPGVSVTRTKTLFAETAIDHIRLLDYVLVVSLLRHAFFGNDRRSPYFGLSPMDLCVWEGWGGGECNRNRFAIVDCCAYEQRVAEMRDWCVTHMSRISRTLRDNPISLLISARGTKAKFVK